MAAGHYLCLQQRLTVPLSGIVNWPELPSNLPLVEFSIALLIGALVGIERERKKVGDHADSLGGLRTFILFAEAGAISGWLSRELESQWPFAVAALMVGALIVVGYFFTSHTNGDGLGMTTEIAAVVVFGYRDLAVILAITTSALLAYKQPLHGLVEKLSQDDLFAGLKLLIATFIVLPILPNQPVDPWGAINPYRMWWLVILISGLSLAGYIASRWLGTHRGIGLTGFFGGLASSTAVTLALSKRSIDEADQPNAINGLTAGLLISWTVMFIRIMVEVAVVNAALLRSIFVPVAAMGVVTVVVAGLYYIRGRQKRSTGDQEVPLKNPFSLTAAVKFALFFTLIQLIVKLAQTYLPAQSFYGVAALAGLTDVDAITLSMAEYARDGEAEVASTSIVIAAIANTLVKCGLVFVLGARSLGLRVGIATAIVLAVGVFSSLDHLVQN
jgi:uncharacterized membrane protein (DUF4010 family)